MKVTNQAGCRSSSESHVAAGGLNKSVPVTVHLSSLWDFSTISIPECLTYERCMEVRSSGTQGLPQAVLGRNHCPASPQNGVS
jgi:hypothetical protein